MKPSVAYLLREGGGAYQTIERLTTRCKLRRDVVYDRKIVVFLRHVLLPPISSIMEFVFSRHTLHFSYFVKVTAPLPHVYPRSYPSEAETSCFLRHHRSANKFAEVLQRSFMIGGCPTISLVPEIKTVLIAAQRSAIFPGQLSRICVVCIEENFSIFG